ncbi:hypothetical protein TNCV_294641 [Trichonephila clavipes]|nr:hypothetical protein TNCV_294641 [Trichonephila clavipes]
MNVITRRSTAGSTEVQSACRRATKSICVVTTSPYTSTFRLPSRKNPTVSAVEAHHAGAKIPVLPIMVCHPGTLLKPHRETPSMTVSKPFRQQIWSKQVIP